MALRDLELAVHADPLHAQRVEPGRGGGRSDALLYGHQPLLCGARGPAGVVAVRQDGANEVAHAERGRLALAL